MRQEEKELVLLHIRTQAGTVCLTFDNVGLTNMWKMEEVINKVSLGKGIST